MKHIVFLTRSRRGLGLPSARRLIKKAVFVTLDAEGVDLPCEISVLLTDDEGIKALNNDFRGMDKSTDVLSFPANEMTVGELRQEQMEHDPKTGRIVLGDMAISLEHTVAQGKEYGHGAKREIQYLTVHSVLHLLGYDHVDEGLMKRQMRSREKLIMSMIERRREQ